jgi:hypothetical protein
MRPRVLPPSPSGTIKALAATPGLNALPGRKPFFEISESALVGVGLNAATTLQRPIPGQ